VRPRLGRIPAPRADLGGRTARFPSWGFPEGRGARSPFLLALLPVLRPLPEDPLLRFRTWAATA